MAKTRPSSPKIKNILGKWRSSLCVYYLVKWEDGYTDTWERIEDVNKQIDILDDWRTWLKERNILYKKNRRGSFRPEATTSSVKHGLTEAMLKHVLLDGSPSITAMSQPDQNSSVNTEMNIAKSKNPVNSKVRKKTKASSVIKLRLNKKLKVVSKPKNAKSASSKIYAARTKPASSAINSARTKAVKMLTAKKTTTRVSDTTPSKTINKKSKPRKRNSDKISNTPKKSVQSVINRSAKAHCTRSVEPNKVTARSSRKKKDSDRSSKSKAGGTTDANSTKTNDMKSTGTRGSSLDRKDKPHSIVVKSTSSSSLKSLSNQKSQHDSPCSRASNITTVESKNASVNMMNINKTNKVQPDSINFSPNNLFVTQQDNSRNILKFTKSTGESVSPKTNVSSEVGTNTSNGSLLKSLACDTKNSARSKYLNVFSKSRKRPSTPLSGESQDDEPAAKKLKENSSVALTKPDVSKVTETDDTDSETLYSLGTPVVNDKNGSKKNLRLKLFNIRPATSSECSTPDSVLECTMTRSSKDHSVSLNSKSQIKTELTSGPKVCRVCGGEANGSHYGAVSCESCRTFFKRTVLQHARPKPCLLMNCTINKSDRKCSHCRLMKCISAGMGTSNSHYKSAVLKFLPQPTELPLPSDGNSLYKTPPRTPEADADTPEEILDSVPDIPIMPMLPNSPAASHRNFMKRMKTLEADRGMKRSEGAEIERRTSVRQSESSYKYKHIVVKKSLGFTQIWLFTTATRMKNALNIEVFNELTQALENARKDDSKIIMLSGQGSMFCSGIDLTCIMGDQKHKLVNTVKDFTNLMISYPKPIVAVVNGPAIGYGSAFLPLCDIVYASDKASFHCPYSRLNQTPEACSSFTFPQVMGSAMANEMLLAGRKLTALEAHQAGLVSHVFWPTSMMQEVVPRLQQMAQNSAKALEASKLLIRSHQKTKLEFTNETECQLLHERWSSVQTLTAVESYLREEKDV